MHDCARLEGPDGFIALVRPEPWTGAPAAQGERFAPNAGRHMIMAIRPELAPSVRRRRAFPRLPNRVRVAQEQRFRMTACLLRSAIYEETPVKTRARRSRDFPTIYSASSAKAERHETICGCSHSHLRRRNAPWRTTGCNLEPALDLDVDPGETASANLELNSVVSGASVK